VQGLLAASGATSTLPRCSPTSASARGCRCAASWRGASRLRLLPGTPETTDLAQLFQLLFVPDSDAAWLEALDDDTLERAGAAGPEPAGARHAARRDDDPGQRGARRGLHAGDAPAHGPALLADDPFRQLTRWPSPARGAAGRPQRRGAARSRAPACAARRLPAAADSVRAHLEEYGVSVDIVFELDQLRERTSASRMLLDAVLAPGPRPELRRLVLTLLRVQAEQRGGRAGGAPVPPAGAPGGRAQRRDRRALHHPRPRRVPRTCCARAAGGGAVIAGTVFVKFAVTALGLSAFWAGFWAGVNYAASFVIVMLLHWTVATKQPAMTAAAMAATLARRPAEGDDRVGSRLRRPRDAADPLAGGRHLRQPDGLRAAGAGWCRWPGRRLFGAPLVGPVEAEYVLQSLTLLGPTALFAAFTGVLLFASSLIAGWTENWFVFHRLDSAIAWNPRIVALLGAAARAALGGLVAANVSGLAANISLGLMLGLVPAWRLLRAAAGGAPRHAVDRPAGGRARRAGLGRAGAAGVLVVRGGIVVTGVLNLTA
jgi:site-specific recombinase